MSSNFTLKTNLVSCNAFTTLLDFTLNLSYIFLPTYPPHPTPSKKTRQKKIILFYFLKNILLLLFLLSSHYLHNTRGICIV